MTLTISAAWSAAWRRFNEWSENFDRCERELVVLLSRPVGRLSALIIIVRESGDPFLILSAI